MNYRRGLDKMRQVAQGKKWAREFNIYYARMLDVLSREKLYTSIPETRYERTVIIDQLDQLAEHHMGKTYTELCEEEDEPPSQNLLPTIVTDSDSQLVSRKVDNDEHDEPTKTEDIEGEEYWAVLVGINTYKDSAYRNLSYCVQDVQQLYNALLAGGYSKGRIHLLIDENSAPTRADILKSLNVVAKLTTPGDTLLFYFAGHGDTADKEGYLIPTDGSQSALQDTALAISRITTIMKEAAARKKVLIFDACHSGSASGARGAKPMSPEFIRRVYEQAQGMAVISSCDSDQYSYEAPELQGGVFTRYFVEGLQSAADRDEKGFVTVLDINRYVCDKVVLWASDNRLVQKPMLQYLVQGEITLATYQETRPPGPEGLVEALQEGRVYQDLVKEIQTSGNPLPGVELPALEDLLARYLNVPLHAMFLYTSEDPHVEHYLKDHWKALDSLSRDICDIHPIVAQLNNLEDAYDYIDKLAVLQEAKFSDLLELPGIFFWNLEQQFEYISFGYPVSSEKITRIVRTIFNEIKKEPNIAAVTRAKLQVETSLFS